MYQKPVQATQQDIAAFGMPAEMLGCVVASPDEVAVWPEHESALEIFDALSTQWRVGFAGATGLDYSVLPAIFDLYELPQSDRRDRLAEIRVMEGEALRTMHEGKA